MADLRNTPSGHPRKAYPEKAGHRRGFRAALEGLEPEHQLVDRLLRARTRAGLTQDAVTERMGTTKSAISRMEAAGRHAPLLPSLQRHAKAIGCELRARLVPQR